MTHLVKGFHENFEVIQANKQALIEQSFALRYQVYCVERPFEPSICFQDGKETDAYDKRSVHSLVYHRGMDRYVGSVRLILADVQSPQAAFPIENLCGDLRRVRQALSDTDFRVAEISRFAISKIRRSGSLVQKDSSRLIKQPSKPASNILPHATLGLFAAIVRMSADNNITHWYALMEPTLTRLLGRFGIYFQPAGPLIQYRGMRQPVMGEVDRVLSRIYVERPDVWELITDSGRTWPLNEALVAQMDRNGSSSGWQGQEMAHAFVSPGHGVFQPADGAAHRFEHSSGKRVQATAV
jgi:N-acyl amino acid synthase of PEP-CTERM/exosortase system